MLNYQYSTAGQNVQGKGAKEPGANKPESEQARGRTSQEARCYFLSAVDGKVSKREAIFHPPRIDGNLCAQSAIFCP